jgi:uncharacterized membrane protein YcfT
MVGASLVNGPRAAARGDDNARIGWVDVAKGLSIVLVVTMHSTLGVEAALGREGFMHAVVAFAEPFRMPAFFLLAGLFLSRAAERPWRETLDGKLLHFAYFYLLWMTIQFVVKHPAFLMREGAAATAGLWLGYLVEPLGTLWFIYLLPLFFLAAKLLRRVPWPLLLAGASALHLAQVHTGSIVIDEFAGRFVFFLVGGLFAPAVFRLAEAVTDRPVLALLALAAWFVAAAVAVQTGVWRLPGLTLVFGLAGAAAVVTTAALLRAVWLDYPLAVCGRWSLAIYLAFFLPMAATRTFLVSRGWINDAGIVALVVTIAAVVVPLALHRLVQVTGIGRFLFERPSFARLPSSSRSAGVPAPAAGGG